MQDNEGRSGDNPGKAASQLMKAVRQTGKEVSKNAVANSSAALVKAGVESGKAVSEVAVGTAAGGPWGAIISAAWSMRHTLYKILVCLFLLFVVIIVILASLPSIIIKNLFGIDGDKPDDSTTIESVYSEMSEELVAVVDEGYDYAVNKADKLIENGGYDYELSKESLNNMASGSAGYDVCYILAAYSVSLGIKEISKDDMITKLRDVKSEMFPVTSEKKEGIKKIPAEYNTYKEVKVTVAVKENDTYKTEEKTLYEVDETKKSDKEIEVDAYKAVEVEVPVYSGSTITGTEKKTYYEKSGKETVKPAEETVKYLECTIHPFDNVVIAKAFGINLDLIYGVTGITYGEAIENMANTLKRFVYSMMGGGESVPLTDAELIEFVNSQNCNDTRKHILTTALSLVGKVPYFWGGKSDPGWNDAWNTPRLVTAVGSSSTGTIRPYGLDCSGFTAWVYSTALGEDIGAGTSGQYGKTTAVEKKDLLPGDLGFYKGKSGDGWNHVLMFAGYDKKGNMMWVHSSSSGGGVVLNSPSYINTLVLRRPSGIDYNAKVVDASSGKSSNKDTAYGEPLYEIEVDVTHYCNCAKCCGKWAGGNTASGKKPASGMVAMSSHYPFGTQIMIKGTMYTVEDRGGDGIENDIHRVDIFVSDHNTALKMGRYKTKAKIYRLGR